MGRLRSAVAREARSAGFGPTEWVATEAHDGGAARLREALERVAPAVVVAAGGDGTVSVAASALAGGDAPLAVLPTGTTNLFARSLGVGRRGAGRPGRRSVLERAFATGSDLSDARADDRVDLGRFRATREDGSVIEGTFTVMVGAGIDAAMVADTHPLGKERLGWLGYVQGISASILRNERFAVRVSRDGSSAMPDRVHTVVVANGGLLPAGLVFVPGAAIDDGALDLMTLRPHGPWSWTRLSGWFLASTVRAPRAVGAALAGPVVSVDRVSRASITFDEPQRAEADGEELGRITHLDAWIEPRSLPVLR